MMIKNYKKSLLVILTISILATISNFAFAQQIQVQPQKNILILNSYNEGTAWTNDQNSGIIETIEEAHNNSAYYVEYMDWKNYPSNSNLNYLYNYYKYKYKDKNLDLIITTDDSAFTFALENREELFSNAPIVFSGVNQDTFSKIRREYKNFTGIIEEINPTETINMALSINPAIKKIYVVFDNSESGISTGKLVSDKIEAMNMNLKVIQLNGLDFNTLLEVVSKLDNTSIVFFATYYSDVTGNIIEFNLASKEISKNSRVPLYHQYDFGLNKGAFGGDMMSGKLSGNHAAQLALRILNGETADSIPASSPKITRKVFDYKQLDRFNISLNKLPKDAEIINKPFSFYETYRTLVLGVLLAFTILLIFLLTLLIYINKIRNVKKQLSIVMKN